MQPGIVLHLPIGMQLPRQPPQQLPAEQAHVSFVSQLQAPVEPIAAPATAE